jgi:alcohol dehydrogenase
VAEASDINIRALQSRAPEHGALAKYARVGALCGGAGDGEALRHHLVTTLRELTARLALPRLGAFEMTEADVPRVVADSRGSSMKTNPVVLTDAEIAEVLRRRL